MVVLVFALVSCLPRRWRCEGTGFNVSPRLHRTQGRPSGCNHYMLLQEGAIAFMLSSLMDLSFNLGIL